MCPETCAAGYHPFVEDYFCNDETNNAACNYDGGDCCGSCVLRDYCSDCECLTANQENYNNPLVGNGFCNDETNTAACNYDGGDCCGSNVNLQYCYDCECIHGD